MPLYKVAKFADMTGKKPKDIHAYVAQKKLVKTKEGFIDTDVAINGSFLKKHQGKILESEVARLESPDSIPEYGGGGGKEPYFLDVKRGEYLDVQTAVKKIDLERKQGEVFPIELVKELVQRQAKGLTEAYKQDMERVLDLWTIKFKIPATEMAKTIKELAEGINKAQLDSIELVKAEMIAVAREIGAKKGIGEHE